MDQALADNIRALREARSWTQEHLAAVAELSLRTIQRAEAATGANADTVLALAAAFDVDVDVLRFDAMAFLAHQLGVSRDQMTPELLAAKQKEVAAKYTTIPLSRVDSSSVLRPVADADAMYFDCIAQDDDSLDGVAALKQQLMDLIDIGTEIDATDRRELEKETFELVKELRASRLVVSLALHRHKLKPAEGDAMPWSTLYVIVAPENEVRETLLIEKRCQMRFSR